MQLYELTAHSASQLLDRLRHLLRRDYGHLLHQCLERMFIIPPVLFNDQNVYDAMGSSL